MHQALVVIHFANTLGVRSISEVIGPFPTAQMAEDAVEKIRDSFSRKSPRDQDANVIATIYPIATPPLRTTPRG